MAYYANKFLPNKVAEKLVKLDFQTKITCDSESWNQSYRTKEKVEFTKKWKKRPNEYPPMQCNVTLLISESVKKMHPLKVKVKAKVKLWNLFVFVGCNLWKWK